MAKVLDGIIFLFFGFSFSIILLGLTLFGGVGAAVGIVLVAIIFLVRQRKTQKQFRHKTLMIIASSVVLAAFFVLAALFDQSFDKNCVSSLSSCGRSTQSLKTAFNSIRLPDNFILIDEKSDPTVQYTTHARLIRTYRVDSSRAATLQEFRSVLRSQGYWLDQYTHSCFSLSDHKQHICDLVYAEKDGSSFESNFLLAKDSTSETTIVIIYMNKGCFSGNGCVRGGAPGGYPY